MKTIVNIVPSWPSKYKKADCVFLFEQIKNLAIRSENYYIIIVGYPVAWYIKNRKNIFLEKPITIDLPNVKIYHFFYVNKFETFLSFYSKLKILFRSVTKNHLQILIHAHFLNMGFQVLKLKKDFGVPFFLTEHSSQFIHYFDYFKFSLTEVNDILNAAEQIIAVSPFLKNDMISQSSIIDKTKIDIIPNGVDVNKFYSTHETKTKFNLLFIGLITQRKGISILLEAFLKIQNIFDYTLTLVGDGDLKQYCTDFIKINNLENKVTLLGSVDNNALPKIINQHHVLLLPSFNESFGVVVIEALACGIPAIVTACGGPEYIVDQLFLGEVIPIGDIEALAHAIKKVRNNYIIYDAVKIHKNVETRFGWDSITAQILKKYDSLPLN